MAYRVRLTERSQKDLRAIYAYIQADHSDKALAWYLRLKQEILTLREFPDRCPITPEDSCLRHLLFGKRAHVYRVIYRVVEAESHVEVLHVRSAGLPEFSPGEFLNQA